MRKTGGKPTHNIAIPCRILLKCRGLTAFTNCGVEARCLGVVQVQTVVNPQTCSKEVTDARVKTQSELFLWPMHTLGCTCVVSLQTYGVWLMRSPKLQLSFSTQKTQQEHRGSGGVAYSEVVPDY